MASLFEMINSPQDTTTESGVKKQRTFQDLLNEPSIQGGSIAKVNPEYGEETQADRLAFAARMGFQDTWRGVKQLLGTDEEQMAEDQRRLNMYLQNEEYGGSILATYTAGLFGDPVGWVLPGMKARNAYKAVKAGVVAGGIAGATGYVDEEGGMNRLNNTLLGMAGGGVLSPAMYKFNKSIMPLLSRGYSNMGSAIDSGKINQDLGIIAKSFSYAGAKVGAPVYGQAKKAGNYIKGTGPGKTFGSYVIENFGLPDNYVKAKGTKKQMESKWAGDFNDVLEKFSKLTPEQDAALYRVMTPNGGVPLTKSESALITPELEALGKEGRTVVNRLGKQLVDLGLLNEDTFIANKNSYLYRSYEKTEGLKNKKIIRDENNLGVIASELVRRGDTKTFRTSKGQTKAQLQALKEKDGWRFVKNSGNNDVTMNKDFSPEKRKQMGEIISSTFALAKTGKLMSNDVAAFKFYDDITKMGDDVVMPKGIANDLIPDGWRMIPTTKVGVGGKKTEISRFGKLSGRYVSPEVYKDLVWADRFKRYRQGGEGLAGSSPAQLHRKMLQYWKRTKTSLNPVVHMNNVMSNVVLYDLVDGNYKHLASAGKDFYRAFKPNKNSRVKSEDFRMAEKLGIFDANVMKRELTDFEQDTFARYMKIGKQNDSEILEKTWEGTKKFAGKTPLDKLYSAEDSVFRLALFKDHLAKNVKGLIPTEDEYAAAGKHARKYMLDYEIDAPAVQLMRETAMPFISYTYRAAPIIAETILKKPWKIAKWGLILNVANDFAADDAEYKTERKRQKELESGYDVMRIPGANTLIKLPNEKYLDVSRWIPAGDVLQVKEQGFNLPFLPTPLQPSGGALGGIGKIAVGFDTFTKQMVPGVGSGVFKDSFDARFGMQRDSMLGKEFIPLWNQGWNIYDSYVASGRKHPTKDDRTLNESLLGAVGIKVKTYDEDKMAMRVSYKYQNKMKSLEAKIKKMSANKQGGRIDKDSYDKSMKRLTSELKRIQGEAKEAMKKVR